MELPELSHLQYAVLDCVGTGTVSGKDLRKSLSKLGLKQSGPSFYQMMARLEESKFVEGKYSQEVIDGQIIKERQYRILGDGLRAMRQTEHFYNRKTKHISGRPAFA